MKEKVKKIGKVLLAFVLTLAMVLQYWGGVTFQTEAETGTGGYRELSVSDWGIVKGAYEAGFAYSLQDTSITSLDGTAFTAMLTYNTASELRIGGSSGKEWYALDVYFDGDAFVLNDQSGGGKSYSISGKSISKTEAFKLRLTFDQDSVNNQWDVGVWINDEYIDTYTFANMVLGTKLLINGSGMTIADAVRGYRELTFSDWGIVDGIYESGATKTYTPKEEAKITTLDGKAFTGMFRYKEDGDFRIGGGNWYGLQVYWSTNDSRLHFLDNTGSNQENFIALNGITTEDAFRALTFKLRMTFNKGAVNNSWIVGVWIDDVFIEQFTYTGMNLGTDLLFSGTGLVISDAVKETKNLTFSDWGIEDGQYVAGDPGYSLQNGLTSLNGTIFQGNVSSSSNSWIRFGGKDNVWAGILIYGTSDGLVLDSEVDGYASVYTYTIPYTDKNLSTDLFKLKMTIDYDVDNNVVLGIWINEEFQRYITYTGMATAFGTGMLMDSAGLVLSDVKDASEEIELTDITWENFGIGEYEELAGAYKTYDASSLVNTSFRGKVQFPKVDSDSSNYYICYGANEFGWDGIRVIPLTDGTLRFDALIDNGNNYAFQQTIQAPASIGNFVGTTFELGIDLIQAGDDLNVFIYVEGELQNDEPYVWTGAVTSGWAGTNANFITTKADDKIVVGQKPTFSDISFVDFDVVYEVCEGTNNYFTYQGDSLIGTSFSGPVFFNKVNDASVHYAICYAAPTEGGWDGFRLEPTTEGKLKIYDPWDEAALSTTLEAPTKLGNFLNQGFELGIELWTYKNDAKINVYANGTLCNAEPIVWKDAVTNNCIGKYMTVLASEDGDAIVLGEEQPIEQLPADFMEITFNDFGLADKAGYYNEQNKGLVVNGETDLDRKILSTDLWLSSGKFQIFYGKTPDSLDGLYFLLDRDANTITLLNGGSGADLHTFTAQKGGFDLTSASPVHLDITTEFVNNDNGDGADDVKIGVFINGVLYDNKYIYFNNYRDFMSSYVSLSQWGSADLLTISNPTRLLPADYEQMTFRDVGMSDVENKTQEGVSEKDAAIDWDGLIFSGKARLAENSEIRFGSSDGWQGCQIQITGDQLVFNDPTDRFTGNIATWSDIHAEDLFSFSIATKYIDLDGDGADDMKLGLWINGEMYGNRWFYILDYVMDTTYAVSYIMGANGSDGKMCSLYSYLPSTESGSYDNGKYYYNVNEGGYLLSTSGMITVNDKAMTNGEVLTTPGDYNIVRQEGNTEYKTTAVLWSYGDAHPDGEINVADLIAIKKATKAVALVTESGLKGADITKDGSINDADLTLVRDVLLGKKVLDDSYNSTALSYASGDSKVMPIGGFWGPYGDLLTDEVFAKIKDSGINLLTYSTETYGVEGETDNILGQLRLAEKYGLSMFIRDSGLVNKSYTSIELADRIASYSMYQSFKGLTGLDEPSASNGTYGEGASGYLNAQAQFANSVNSYANLTTYINLYPLDSDLGNEAEYKSYLDEYCETYNPKMLSYDDYLFLGRTSSVTNCGEFFENLAIVRNKAEECKIPFWTFVQSGVWEPNNTWWYDPDITEGEMKWQANIALAFGAKGIQYFPVVNPSTVDSSHNWMQSGLLDTTGNETEWFGYAKKINAQIVAVDDVLMNSTNMGIMLDGTYAKNNISNCGVPVLESYKQLMNVTSNDTSYTEYGAVVGCFDYQGKTALYVVNYNTNGANSITLTLDSSYKTKKITSAGVSETTGNTLNVNLTAGEAALVVID